MQPKADRRAEPTKPFSARLGRDDRSPVITTSFTMDVGETVVVGTSRLSGNSKALIALLAAVPAEVRAALTPRRGGDNRGCRSAAAGTTAPLAPSKSRPVTRRIMAALYEQHPGADTELHFEDAYQLLVATILSAQCTDERVNQVTPALFKRYPDAARAGPRDDRRARAADPVDRLLPREVEIAERHGHGSRRGARRRGADDHGGAGRAARRRAQDRQRRARPRARRPGPAGRSPRPARRQPHRHRPFGRSRGRARQQLARRDAAGGLDAHVGHADPARPPHLQAEAAVRQCAVTADCDYFRTGRQQDP